MAVCDITSDSIGFLIDRLGEELQLQEEYSNYRDIFTSKKINGDDLETIDENNADEFLTNIGITSVRDKAVLRCALVDLKKKIPSKKRNMFTPIVEDAIVPDVVFKARVRDDSIEGSNPFKWKDVSSHDLFRGKRVVIFSLPGAFTPTCSSTHLPGYERDYHNIKALGVDEVYCISVNDAFVMRQWGLHLGLHEEKYSPADLLNPGNFMHVKLIPDGAALFTRGMGMNCVWETQRGFGERSWRYSAVINDLRLEKIFVEGRNGVVVQDSEDDPFVVSDSATMIEYLKIN